MTRGLKRLHESGQSHFVTFSCDRRQQKLVDPALCSLFVERLESMRVHFSLRVYGYVVMPEHVHLLLSEPNPATLADAIRFLKLSFTKQVRPIRRESDCESAFWQKRYYDRNIRDFEEFTAKLRYIHRNPVKRGLCGRPEDWQWSSFRHYVLGERSEVEIESTWTAKARERSRSITAPG